MTAFRRAVTPVVATLVLVAGPAGAQDFSDVTIEDVPLAGAVHVLIGAGGNIGVSSGADGILIVDDQMAPLAPKIRAALGALGDSLPAFVLNTHFHHDHTGGNVVFGESSTIVAHRNVRERLSTRQEVLGTVYEPEPEVALPVITFGDSLSVWFNGEEIRAVHVPRAHTDGDVVVWFTGSNVVHMGDLFFNGRFPFIDLGSGGDVEGYLDGVSAVLAAVPPDARVIPGHGPPGSVADLEEFRVMLQETIRIVRDRIAAGMGLEDVRAAGLPEEWAEWGSGFVDTDRWIETIWRSLTDQPGQAYHPHGHDGDGDDRL